MDNKYKKLIKNTGYLTASNFASKILVYFLVPLYTYVLSTEEYGKYDTIVTTVQIITPILIANISDGLMRFLMDTSYDNDDVARIGYKYLFIGYIFIGLITLINVFFFHVPALNGYELYTFLYAILFITNSFYTQYAKGINKVNLMAISGVISTLSVIVSNIIFLLVFKWGLSGFFLANIISLFCSVLFYISRLGIGRYRIAFFEISELDKTMLAYSLPLIFNVVGWSLNSSLDKYCVIFFYGFAANGILAVSYKIPTILNTIYSIFTQAWQISAVEEYVNDNRIKFYSNTFLVFNSMGSICCAFLIVFNKTLAQHLFLKDFYDAWRYVPFLLLSSLFNQTAGFIGPLLSAKKNSRAMAIAAIWGSVSNFILNVVLLMVMGVQGATIATAISSFIIFYVRWYYARDLLEKEIYVPIYVTWILLLASCIVESYEITNYAIQIIILFVIFIINSKYIFTAIQKIIRRSRK